MAVFADYLLTDASLAEQTEILKAIVCPQLDDADACMATIDMWFKDIATCIYPHFIVDGDVCTIFGICKKASIFTPRDWTCDECTDLLTQAAGLMQDEATVAEGVEYLQGECFCGADGHSADCADMVAGIVPLSMPVLAGILVDQEVELCQEVVGVC